jgi:hypothetical protein
MFLAGHILRRVNAESVNVRTERPIRLSCRQSFCGGLWPGCYDFGSVKALRFGNKLVADVSASDRMQVGWPAAWSAL